MNIFVLDEDPVIAAQYHNDKHVVKMILESVQMLSTAYRFHNPQNSNESIYRSTHVNHPCTLWVKESKHNFRWLVKLTYALHREWNLRYNHSKTHKSMRIIDDLSCRNFPDIGLTPFAQAMPDDVKQENPVLAYRDYYINYKQHLAKWTNRIPPFWYPSKC
jgi:hypothetical protein